MRVNWNKYFNAKKGSLLLSHTGLKYYYKNDKNVFEQIKRRYLSKRWHNSDFETQIKEIAHNIRNSNSNQKIKQKRLYPINQINIFTSTSMNEVINKKDTINFKF